MKLHLNKINPGNYSKERETFESFIEFNNGIISIDSNSMSIRTKKNKTVNFRLNVGKSDTFSNAFLATLDNGIAFRVVRPADFIKAMMNAKGDPETLTFASPNGDGYAVHFVMVPESSPDKPTFEKDRSTEFISALESKAETLVGTAESLFQFNPSMAKEHIERFLKLLYENEIELLKFTHIQNLIQGISLAIHLNILDEELLKAAIEKIKFSFLSIDHRRSERGQVVSGQNRVRRRIEIVPNYELKEGYIVTIYNQEGLHPFWGDNVQMAPKQMKIEKKSLNEIKLVGFGYDNLGGSFSDYGLTININNNSVTTVVLHLRDRQVDLTYLR